MLLFELFSDPVDYEYVEDASADGEEMYWTFETPNGVPYEVLIQRAFNDPVNVYSVEFSNEKAVGKARHQVTGTGEELVVFATVMEILKEFASSNQGIFTFTSDQANRTKLYARMAKRYVPAPFTVEMGKSPRGEDAFYIGMPDDIAAHKAANEQDIPR